MNNSIPTKINSKVLQRGVASVEFALIVPLFLMLLLGAMEFGRLLYLWNTAQEVTRSAARLAVVWDFNDVASIKCSAMFRIKDCTLPASLPASSEISDANVVIRYLNAAGGVASPRPLNPGDNIAACLDKNRVNECIRYVEVCLLDTEPPLGEGDLCSAGQSIAFKPMIGLFSGSDPNSPDLRGIRIPLSTVRMPAENLGFDPTSPES